MMFQAHSLRNRLLIGVSLGSMLLTGVAEAQNSRISGGRSAGADPAAAAARAAQTEALRQGDANAATRRALENFTRAAATRQAMTDAQTAARAAAFAAQSNVPNGLGHGGLQVAEGVTLDPSLWVGANGPKQTVGADGRTLVTVDQTRDKAILTWDSFNVGRETDLVFAQDASNWVVLNRVTDVSADPTRILGNIKANGSVFIINRNGVIFGGSSQVNVRNLVASTADISNIQFMERGIHSNVVIPPEFWLPPITMPAFTDAGGAVTVEAGARIRTAAPATVVEGGGYVMLMGKTVENRGTIVTDRGQTILSAGDNFLVRAGYGTLANQASTTRGQEIAITLDAGSTSGRVVNTGVIEAREGDITLAGHTVIQGGVAVATTSVNTRGTIHLLTDLSDATSSVTLTGNSLTLILPELDSKTTATNAQRDALIAESLNATGRPSLLNNQGIGRLGYLQPDRKDMSRVEITTGGEAIFQGGSQTIAQGGQIAVVAMKRTTIDSGALLDVSGVQDVMMDMASNNLKINVRPFDMRDSALNREGDGIRSTDVWIDVRDLVLMPSGTGGHVGDRYYAPGGLLEVGGHLGNTAHGIGEWSSVGGTININSAEIVIKDGAVLDISGGSMRYAGGYMQSTRMMGSDGRMYDIGQAPAGVKMLSIGDAFVRSHERWGEAYTKVYGRPLFSGGRSARWEDGYTVGRDAGVITLSAPTVLMQGQIMADVIIGERQVNARPQTSPALNENGIANGMPNRLDGYGLPQNVSPLAGGLYIGAGLAQNYSPAAQTVTPFNNNVVIGDATTVAGGVKQNQVLISADTINDAGLGALRIVSGKIAVENDVTLANGGQLAFTATEIAVNADLTARSGSISLAAVQPCSAGCATVTDLSIGDGVRLDTRGLWVNLATGGDRADMAHLDGGAIMLDSRQGDLRLGKGSVIDASAGGAIREDGSFVSANGGDVGLGVGFLNRENANEMVLDGEIRSYGSGDGKGGRLTLSAAGRPITIGETVLGGGDVLKAGDTLPLDLQLTQDLILPAGWELPFDYSYTVDRIAPGGTFAADTLVEAYDFVIGSDWTVPPGMVAYDPDYAIEYSEGMVIPAGSPIGVLWGEFTAGYELPADAFPNGLAIPAQSFSYTKGTVLETDLKLPKGRMLEAGLTLPVDAHVAKPLHLGTDFFQAGFSNYDIRSGGDLQVRGVIDVTAPVRRYNTASANIASGAAPEDAMELWLPEMFREDAVKGRFIQRQGAGLTLTANGVGPRNRVGPYGDVIGDPQNLGNVTVAAGSVIRVDDGQSVNLNAAQSILMEGRIEAHGGSVSLTAGPKENTNRDYAGNIIHYDAKRAVWLGENSIIDVSGRARTAVDAFGLRYASLSKGGSISVGGETAAYVVVRPGAVLDASGAAAEIDYLSTTLPETRNSLKLATDGGSIAFRSQYGIFLDGEMRAKAGGAGASGGLLSVTLNTPYLPALGSPTRDMPDFMRQLRSIYLDETHESSLRADIRFGDCITGCWAPGQTTAEAELSNAGVGNFVGQARLGVDQIKKGGFDSLTLATDDVILLNGAIDLNLSRNLTLTGSIANLQPDTDARLSAAYVKLAGAGRMLGNDLVQHQLGAIALFKRPDIGRGELTITGGLIDIGSAQFGVNGSIGLSGGRLRDYDYLAPKQVNLVSGGDIRMTGGDLNALSNISLTAAQIYPLTNVLAGIYAGKYAYRIPGSPTPWNTLMTGSTVSFHKLDGVTPSAPLSIYGSLTVGADIINQGGVLRAPLGSIQLGVGGYSFVPGPEALQPGQTSWNQVAITTSEINLLNGSLTSVSARDLVIPFGGTTDGLTWLLNGVEKTTTNLLQGVAVVGSLRADEGSVLDLSGGGTPAGGAFINGRGGSVDILTTALANVSPAFQGLSQSDNKVYAIVPDYKGSAAPTALAGHAQPGVGQQIVIPEGVPGLPAGTYMLLPAEFALMDGAFRVELGSSLRPGAGGLNTLADGSVHLGVTTTYANTTAQSALQVEAILTSSKTVRTYSQYNETSFGDFLMAAPTKAQFDNPLPLLPQDGKVFTLALTPPRGDSDRPVFSFKGKGLFEAAKGGIGGSLAVVGGNPYGMQNLTLEILGAGGVATPGALSLYAADLNAVGAKVMTIGGLVQRAMGVNVNDLLITAGGGLPNGVSFGSGFGGVTVREGAELIAPQVLLISSGNGNILVEDGARISTLGQGDPAFSSAMGYTLRADNINLLSVSNGLLEYTSTAGASGSGSVTVEDGASIYTDGTLSFVSPGVVRLGENVNYGARYLGFSTGSVNLGTTQALADAAAQGILPGGIALNQTVLDRLMRGDPASGAPRLERLMLSANQSINFYGSISLDTRDPATGKSSLQLVLNTPALYGHGTADDVARITTGTLVWNGLLGNQGTSVNSIPTTALPGATIANGPGTGLGMLDLIAERIVLGYQDGVAISSNLPLNRLALGFGSVNLTASDRIEANHYGDLAVYQSQAVYGQAGQGGVLNLNTPLLTGQAGSRLHYKAGDAINVRRGEGQTASTGKVEAALGAEIRLTAGSILADTTIALPSGKLVMTATTGDIRLQDGARLDLAGRDTKFFDETRYSWGGDVELESTQGSVQQAAGSTIDISADYNHAGVLKVTALQGAVNLNGSINGRARNGDKPADPAMRNGSIDVRAGTLTDFAGLNRRLTESGVTEARSFVIKTGDLTIGDEVQARHVSISADGGNLTVTGTINASGYRPGSIRLAARDDLTLASTAVLDASGKTLVVDSYGAPIDASNRATIELTSAGGQLTLASGSTLDLSAPDGVKRGQVELNARRLGGADVAIDARGPLTIKGASSLSVNGFRSYQPSGGVIDQALMDGVHADSTAFINAAIGNAALLGRMAGLTAYADAFHLRPGVELRSAAGESLRVSGDLNMAGYRYASLNAATPLTQVYGSGEAGVLLIRAADKLDIYGSITDGFAEPARTPDDNGWVLYPGTQGVNTEWIADHQLSAPLKLAAGAQLPLGASLTFDAPVQGFNVNRNTVIGAPTQLAQTYTLNQDWVATSAIRLPDGSIIAKGAIMTAGTVLPADSMLDAGAVLPMNVALKATTWPKGTPLPGRMTLSAATQLQIGDVLPHDSTVQIDGPFGLISQPLVLTSAFTLVGDPSLATASTIPGGANSTAVLPFEVTIRSGTALRRDSGVIPFGFESNSSMSAPTGGWVPQAPIWASKAAFLAGAAPIWTPGQTVTTSLAAGVWFGAGTVLPRQSAGTAGNLSIRATVVPAGTPFNLFNTPNVYLNANVVAPAGSLIPAGANLQPVGGIMQNTRPIQADGTQGRIWAVAPMLERGSQSWSMRLVAGADLGSADGRTLRAASELAQAGQTGNLTLSDRHYFNPQAVLAPGLIDPQIAALKRMQNFSVIRTGTGSLDLLAGGSYEQLSLYGVYTAGTPSEDIGGLTLDGYNVFNQPRAVLAGSGNLANPWIGEGFDNYAASIQDYRAWYPENGGDVLLSVQNRMIGYSTGRSSANHRVGSGSVGNWLWRQGGYGFSEGRTPQMGEDMPTAWWINFGGYVPNNAASAMTALNFNAPMLEGFMGIGALGGGNLTVRSGGDAGVVADWSTDGVSYPDSNRAAIASTGLNFAVGGTGRVTSVTRTSGVVTDGRLVQTGGGDITILIGGRLNDGAGLLGADLGGSIVSLRGDMNVLAGGIGHMAYAETVDFIDPRKRDLTSNVMRRTTGGVTVVIGDGDVRLDTRGDLVLAGVGDPGSTQMSAAGVSLGYLDASGAYVRPEGFVMNTSFSLWREDTSVNLFSAGGNITPLTLSNGNGAARDGRYWYPPILNVTSASGDIFWDGERCDDYSCNLRPLELAPSPLGQVQFLAKGGISAGGYRTADGQAAYAAGLPIAISGMSNALDLLPNPFRPTWITQFIASRDWSPNAPLPFAGNNITDQIGSLLSFQTDTATGTLLKGSKPPALFYAAGGDVNNLNFGFITYDVQNTYYVNSGAAKIRAGRDIVNLGTGPALGCGLYGAIDCRSILSIPGVFSAGGLVVHNDPSDITLVSAGRDIIYGNMTVAGPGNLVVEAGRNIYQSDKGRFTSVGPLFNLSPSTRNGGAGISVMTGVGAGGPQYDAFNALYLDPANKAEVGRPLADQPGKVAKTYEVELVKWLSDRFGYKAADSADALTYFGKVDEGQRAVFARLVYFDELKAGGREYNNTDSSRFGSYLRGRNAIAVLFPDKDAQGHDVSYAGDLTMVGGSAIRTLFGGNIEVLVAGGQAIVGVGGTIPPSTAGILSMGSGDIDIYALGSVLLGQSRVFTTFGGDLFMWSATGDINAGRGSTSTAVYQPPRRVYDTLGNVTLSPPTQNTGAGIATLAPIPEIPAGDIDLIAPLGTIDAGEAGIRVSGDVNLAALQVLNAANIEVKGSAVGIPVVAAVNTSALTAASNATSTVAAEASRLAERARPITRDMPAIITSRFLGFGEG